MSAEDVIRERIDAVIASDRVVLVMKGTRRQPQCGFSATTVGILDSMLPDYGADLGNIEPLEGRVRINFSDIRDRYSLGYMVLVKHPLSLLGETFYTLYLHLEFAPNVEISDTVEGGADFFYRGIPPLRVFVYVTTK